MVLFAVDLFLTYFSSLVIANIFWFFTMLTALIRYYLILDLILDTATKKNCYIKQY